MSEKTTSAEDVKPETEAEAQAENLTDEEKAALETQEAEQSSDGDDKKGAEESKEEAKADSKAEPEPDEKPKRSRAQERIQQLSTRAKDAEARAKEAERRATRAEKRLADLNADEPNPDSYALGEDDPRFIADLAVYKTTQSGKSEHEQDAQEAKADQEAAQKEAAQARQATFNERAEEFRKSADDFDAVVFNPQNSISPLMGEMIMESEVGPQIAYYLGKNPREAGQIANLESEREVARHFGRIEADIQAPAPKKITAAPTPIKPTATGGGHNSLSPSEMTVDDMEAHLKKTGVL